MVRRDRTRHLSDAEAVVVLHQDTAAQGELGRAAGQLIQQALPRRRQAAALLGLAVLPAAERPAGG